MKNLLLRSLSINLGSTWSSVFSILTYVVICLVSLRNNYHANFEDSIGSSLHFKIHFVVNVDKILAKPFHFLKTTFDVSSFDNTSVQMLKKLMEVDLMDKILDKVQRECKESKVMCQIY